MAEDILDIFSECVRNKRPIKELNGKISFKGRTFPKSTETTFPVKQLRGKNKGGKFYTLEEVSFFMKHRHLPHVEFVKKAHECQVRPVVRPDRNPLLSRICCVTNPAATSGKEKSNPKDKGSSHHRSSFYVKKETSKDAGELPMDSGAGENEKHKPHLRTYSRKRSAHELRSTSQRQSLADEDQFFDMDVISTNSDVNDELAFVKSENVNLERILRSMEAFLRDHFDVTPAQLQMIQESDSNTIELNNIASDIKNKIVHADLVVDTQTSSHENVSGSKFCYKAVKHPVRGWEMTKQSLSSVLSGCDNNGVAPSLEDNCVESIEDCLAKGSVSLKRAISVIISQMREFNKPLTSSENSDMFLQKVIHDCLSDAVDSFRDIFHALLPEEIRRQNETRSVEKWVDVSRAEIGKLFHSLALTLQSLRDIPANPQKQPTSLFHFPEPTFSLALNPAKVTHSVLLEMYVKIGLAELRKIVMRILGCDPEALNSTLDQSCYDEKANNNHGIKEDSMIFYEKSICHSHREGVVFADPLSFPADAQDHSSYMSRPKFCPPSQQSVKQEEMGSTDPSASGSCTSARSNAREGATLRRNGRSAKYLNCSSSYPTRRSFESDYYQYRMFKASLGNTLVSSFKKQIQEKIQASSIQLD